MGDGFSQSLFFATFYERGYGWMRSEGHSIGEVDPRSSPSYLDRILFSSFNTGRRNVVINVDDGLAIVRITQTYAEVTVAAETNEAADRGIESVFSRLPPPDSPEIVTPVNFWAEHRGSSQLTHRRIEPHGWDDISDGYSETVRDGLGALMGLDGESLGGKLILWHGEPGTGKTHALRALAHEWRGWCSLELITDPERLVGGGMSYLMEVLIESGPDPDDDREAKLIVLEDAGELVAADARQQAGPGLSRLLNLTDGLLGIDANALILISTNEPLGRIHPAVHRPGRCLAEIEFTPLAVSEANAWLRRRDSEIEVATQKTIAELYAIRRDGGVEPQSRRPIGFAA